jgi:hypothetical protein
MVWHYYLGIRTADPQGYLIPAAVPHSGFLDLAPATGNNQDALGVFWTDRPDLGLDWLYLGGGDCRELKPNGNLLNSWTSRLHYRPAGETLADWLWDTLTTGADPARQNGPGPLVPTAELSLELVLEGHGTLQSRTFRWGADTHTAKLLAALRVDLNDCRSQALAGQARSPLIDGPDLDWHRRAAQALLEKYGCTWEDLRPPQWEADETPLPHNTNITDNFTDTDGTALSSHTAGGLTWGGTGASVMSIISNTVKHNTTANLVEYARAETDLSTADDYSQITIAAYTDGAVNHQFGASCRMTSAALSGYLARSIPFNSPDTMELATFTTGGSPSQMTTVNQAVAVGGIIKITASGTTLKAFYNGTQTTTTTNSSFTGKRCGIYLFRGDSTTVAVDNFKAGDGTGPPPTGNTLDGKTLNSLTLAGRTLL